MSSKPEALNYNARRDFEFYTDGADFTQKDAHDPVRIFDVTDEDNVEASVIMHSIEYLDPADIELSKKKPKKSTADVIFDTVRNIIYFGALGVFVVCLFLLAQNIIDKIRGAEYYSTMANDFNAEELMLGISGEQTDAAAVYELTEETGASVLTVKTAVQSNQSAASLDFTSAVENAGRTVSGSAGTSGATEAVSESSYNAALEKMKAKLNQYRLVNPDTYGYIYIEGTNINYVLVQSEDNDFYLDHDYEGNPLKIGAIFVDFRNYDNILKNFNTVMYGHNVGSGLMFHDVTKFLDPEVFKSKLIYIYTFDGAYVYEPFAVYDSRYDYQYFQTGFPSAEDFVSFAYEMRGNSKIPSDMEFTTADRIITLSTCTNGLQTMRYVLQAKLVQIIK